MYGSVSFYATLYHQKKILTLAIVVGGQRYQTPSLNETSIENVGYRSLSLSLSLSVPLLRFGAGGLECARWRFRSFPRVMNPIP